MRRFVLSSMIVLLVEVVPTMSGRLPPLPSRETQIEKVEWLNYSRKVITELFPSHPDLVKKLILITENDEPFAVTFSDHIEISTGLIREVRDEKEYSTILAHEVGHYLWQHEQEMLLFSKQNPKMPTEFPSPEEFRKLRLHEAEADFVSIVLTGKLRSVYQLLLRFANKDTSDRTTSPLQQENAKTHAFRLQVMRNMLMSDRFLPIVSAKPLPKTLPKWNSSEQVWHEYSRVVLLAMYPNYKTPLKELVLLTTDKGPLATGGRFQQGNGSIVGIITLNLKWLSQVIHTPEEFAVLLGHEFGHTLAYRDFSKDYLDTDISFSPLELELREQLEADLIGTLPLDRGECIWANTLERIVESTVRRSGNYDPEVDMVRVRRLKKMCTGKNDWHLP